MYSDQQNARIELDSALRAPNNRSAQVQHRTLQEIHRGHGLPTVAEWPDIWGDIQHVQATLRARIDLSRRPEQRGPPHCLAERGPLLHPLTASEPEPVLLTHPQQRINQTGTRPRNALACPQERFLAPFNLKPTWKGTSTLQTTALLPASIGSTPASQRPQHNHQAFSIPKVSGRGTPSGDDIQTVPT